MSITIHSTAAFVLPMTASAALAAFGAFVARRSAVAQARTAVLKPVNGWTATTRVDGTYDPQSRGSSG